MKTPLSGQGFENICKKEELLFEFFRFDFKITGKIKEENDSIRTEVYNQSEKMTGTVFFLRPGKLFSIITI